LIAVSDQRKELLDTILVVDMVVVMVIIVAVILLLKQGIPGIHEAWKHHVSRVGNPVSKGRVW